MRFLPVSLAHWLHPLPKTLLPVPGGTCEEMGASDALLPQGPWHLLHGALFAVDALVVLGGQCHGDLVFLVATPPTTVYFLFSFPNPS